jgi:hypothetical protein
MKLSFLGKAVLGAVFSLGSFYSVEAQTWHDTTQTAPTYRSGNVGIGMFSPSSTLPSNLLELKSPSVNLVLDAGYNDYPGYNNLISFRTKGANRFHIGYNVFPNCGTGTFFLKTGTGNGIHFSGQDIHFGKELGLCGAATIIGKFKFDDQIGAPKLLLAPLLASSPYPFPKIPTDFRFYVHGNSHFNGLVRIGADTTTFPPTGYGLLVGNGIYTSNFIATGVSAINNRITIGTDSNTTSMTPKFTTIGKAPLYSSGPPVGLLAQFKLFSNTSPSNFSFVNINGFENNFGPYLIRGGTESSSVFIVRTNGSTEIGDGSLTTSVLRIKGSTAMDSTLVIGKTTNANATFLSVKGNAQFDTKVVIGSASTPSGYRLYVSDGILTEKVKVAVKSTSNWSDFVFDKDYQLLSLGEVETYIQKHKHLPGIPSAEEVVKEGIDVATMDAKLLQKIEELTLYMIELKKENELMKSELSVIKQNLR